MSAAGLLSLVAAPLLVGAALGILVGLRSRHAAFVAVVGTLALASTGAVAAKMVVDASCGEGDRADTMCAFAAGLVVLPVGFILVGLHATVWVAVLVRAARGAGGGGMPADPDGGR